MNNQPNLEEFFKRQVENFRMPIDDPAWLIRALVEMIPDEWWDDSLQRLTRQYANPKNLLSIIVYAYYNERFASRWIAFQVKNESKRFMWLANGIAFSSEEIDQFRAEKEMNHWIKACFISLNLLLEHPNPIYVVEKSGDEEIISFNLEWQESDKITKIHQVREYKREYEKLFKQQILPEVKEDTPKVYKQIKKLQKQPVLYLADVVESIK